MFPGRRVQRLFIKDATQFDKMWHRLGELANVIGRKPIAAIVMIRRPDGDAGQEQNGQHAAFALERQHENDRAEADSGNRQSQR